MREFNLVGRCNQQGVLSLRRKSIVELPRFRGTPKRVGQQASN